MFQPRTHIILDRLVIAYYVYQVITQSDLRESQLSISPLLHAFLQSCYIIQSSNLVSTKYIPTYIPQFPQHHPSWGPSREFHIPSKY